MLGPRGCLAALLAVVATTLAARVASARGKHQAAKRPRQALWVWDHGAAASDASARERLFAFSAQHGIDTLYYESTELVDAGAPAMDRFVSAASAQGLSVELLFSSNKWVYPDQQEQAVDVVRRAVRSAASLRGTKPVALHFDIEPYLLPEWRAGNKSGVAADYLRLLQKISQAGAPFPVHVDIPFWFNHIEVPSERGPREQPLDQAVLGIVGGCTIMDYRDEAVGPDGLIDHGRPTLEAADRAGKPLVIGVETNPVTPRFVSFYGEDATDLQSQLALVREAFGKDAAFAGTAIESYRGYRQLRP